DAASGRVLLFGGADDANRYLADTWEWDGSGWREHRVPGPSPRHGHVLAHDELRGRTVLFGGSSGGLLADTWAWDGAAWTLCTAQTSPPARYLGGMGFHAELGRTVLFGGWVGHGHASDTWLWDGQSWTGAAPITAPAARGCHGGM